MAATRFRLNAPRVVEETIDGETLIIDMVNGSYFSCIGASAVAWIALSDGATLNEASQLLSATYRIEIAHADRDLEKFVAALLDDELLVVRDEPRDPGGERRLAVLDTPGGDYEPLCVEKYTDLADLILLDPVHDVSVAGWPAKDK